MSEPCVSARLQLGIEIQLNNMPHAWFCSQDWITFGQALGSVTPSVLLLSRGSPLQLNLNPLLS